MTSNIHPTPLNIPFPWNKVAPAADVQLLKTFSPDVLAELTDLFDPTHLKDLEELAQEKTPEALQICADYWYTETKYRAYQQKICKITQKITKSLRAEFEKLIATPEKSTNWKETLGAIYQKLMLLLCPFQSESHFTPHLLTSIKVECYASLTCAIEHWIETITEEDPQTALKVSEALAYLNHAHQHQSGLPLPGYKQKNILLNFRKKLNTANAKTFFTHLEAKNIDQTNQADLQEKLDLINHFTPTDYLESIEDHINGGTITLNALKSPYVNGINTPQTYEIQINYREKTNEPETEEISEDGVISIHHQKNGFTCCFDLLRGEIYIKQNIPLSAIMPPEDYNNLKNHILNLILEGNDSEDSCPVKNHTNNTTHEILQQLPSETLSKQIEKDIALYNTSQQKTIRTLIDRIKSSNGIAQNITRLVSEGPNLYRLKHGPWRIIFIKKDRVIEIIKVSMRSKQTYRHLH